MFFLRLIALTTFLGLLPLSASAQLRFRVSAGMSTDWIVSDNPAVARIVSSTTAEDENAPPGGSLDGMQMGWGLRCYADLDKQKKFRIPFGFDLHSMSGTQQVLSPSYLIRIRHDINIYTTHLGFEYAFAEFPAAFARAYSAVELRGAFIGDSRFSSLQRSYDATNEVVEVSKNDIVQKEGTFRLGWMARLGIEGELYYPIFLNTSIGYGVLNAIGRDTKSQADGGRGELLTPSTSNEGPEQYIEHVNFTFMIQVRL